MPSRSMLYSVIISSIPEAASFSMTAVPDASASKLVFAAMP